MRTIEWTGQFKRDYKGQHRTTLDDDLFPIVDSLANDWTLELRYRDHSLAGAWKDHRDCHIKPDLVLIYQKPDTETLRLVRLGSHSELGL
jgi:mRNA interferase YafQ